MSAVELDQATRNLVLQLRLLRTLVSDLEPALRRELQAQCYAIADAIGELEVREQGREARH